MSNLKYSTSANCVARYLANTKNYTNLEITRAHHYILELKITEKEFLILTDPIFGDSYVLYQSEFGSGNILGSSSSVEGIVTLLERYL